MGMENERPAPLAQGTLEKRPLAHLLAYALEKRLTGSLVFGDVDAPRGSIVLKEGEPRKASAAGVPEHAKSDAAWNGLAQLPLETPFAYFERYDALPSADDAPVGALSAVVYIVQHRPPTEHMLQSLQRIGEGEVIVVSELRTGGLCLEGEKAAALERIAGEPFTLEALRAEPVFGADAEAVLYALVITKIAQLVQSSGI